MHVGLWPVAALVLVVGSAVVALNLYEVTTRTVLTNVAAGLHVATGGTHAHGVHRVHGEVDCSKCGVGGEVALRALQEQVRAQTAAREAAELRAKTLDAEAAVLRAQRTTEQTAQRLSIAEAEDLPVRTEVAAALTAKQVELANQKSTAVAHPAPAAPPTGAASPTQYFRVSTAVVQSESGSGGFMEGATCTSTCCLPKAWSSAIKLAREVMAGSPAGPPCKSNCTACVGTVGAGKYEGKTCQQGWEAVKAQMGTPDADAWCGAVKGCTVMAPVGGSASRR
jgi:hypothetical protein